MRYLLILVAAVGIGAQAIQPPDETNVPANEKRIPPGHYCKAMGVPIGKSETRAHSCGCTYSCYVDNDGNIIDHESEDCLTYCHINGRTCTCHVEEPTTCIKGGNALMDMNGRVIAMVKR
jgi:hypothetical protein